MKVCGFMMGKTLTGTFLVRTTKTRLYSLATSIFWFLQGVKLRIKVPVFHKMFCYQSQYKNIWTFQSWLHEISHVDSSSMKVSVEKKAENTSVITCVDL